MLSGTVNVGTTNAWCDATSFPQLGSDAGPVNRCANPSQGGPDLHGVVTIVPTEYISARSVTGPAFCSLPLLERVARPDVDVRIDEAGQQRFARPPINPHPLRRGDAWTCSFNAPSSTSTLASARSPSNTCTSRKKIGAVACNAALHAHAKLIVARVFGTS